MGEQPVQAASWALLNNPVLQPHQYTPQVSASFSPSGRLFNRSGAATKKSQHRPYLQHKRTVLGNAKGTSCSLN